MEKPTPKLSTDVKLGLTLFMFASSLVLLVFPFLTKSPGFGPSFLLFLGAGLSVTVVTALFFILLNSLNLGFGKSALVLAFGYNAVLVMIKLTLSPYGMYLANQRQEFTVQFLGSDPNSPVYMILVAVIILALYVIVFRSMYGYFVNRLRQNYPRLFPPVPAKVRKKTSVKKQFLVTLLVVAVSVMFTGGVVIIAPLLLLSSGFTYLSYIFGAVGVPLILALGLAYFLAYRSFAAVEKQVIVTGNMMLLSSFLWVGLAMIILYHVMWVIFMVTVVQLWPFKTYTPK